MQQHGRPLCCLPPCIFHSRGNIYYLGFDVHKDDSRVVVLDDDGGVVQEVQSISPS